MIVLVISDSEIFRAEQVCEFPVMFLKAMVCNAESWLSAETLQIDGVSDSVSGE